MLFSLTSFDLHQSRPTDFNRLMLVFECWKFASCFSLRFFFHWWKKIIISRQCRLTFEIRAFRCFILWKYCNTVQWKQCNYIRILTGNLWGFFYASPFGNCVSIVRQRRRAQFKRSLGGTFVAWCPYKNQPFSIYAAMKKYHESFLLCVCVFFSLVFVLFLLAWWTLLFANGFENSLRKSLCCHFH